LIKSIKVMLLPNNKQKTKMFQFCGASRFAYNWTIKKQEENYKLGNKFICAEIENPQTLDCGMNIS
jgi:putative transposase